MTSEGRSSALAAALVVGAMVIIAAGGIVTLLAGWYGLLIVAFGLIDLAMIPFVLRAISGARPDSTTAQPESPEGELPDPDYNPYARED